MTTGQYLTDDVPFSCCRPTSPRPCIHHQVQDNDIHYNYDYHTDLTLHTIGCKEKLMEYFGSQFTKLGAAAFGLLGVQVSTDNVQAFEEKLLFIRKEFSASWSAARGKEWETMLQYRSEGARRLVPEYLTKSKPVNASMDFV